MSEKTIVVVAYAVGRDGEGRVLEAARCYLNDGMDLPPLASGWVYQIRIEKEEAE